MVLKWFGFCDVVLAIQIRVEKARALNAEGAFLGVGPVLPEVPHCGSHLGSAEAETHAGCAHTAGMGL